MDLLCWSCDFHGCNSWFDIGGDLSTCNSRNRLVHGVHIVDSAVNHD